MSSATKRLADLTAHFTPASLRPPYTAEEFKHTRNIHQLSPTFFLPRAAEVEPDAIAVHHLTANGKTLTRKYAETADRARGLAYFLLKHGYKRVGVLCTNTPAFLEAFYGIGGAGAVNIAINYRLKTEDISYIFDHSEVDFIIVDAEFRALLDDFANTHTHVPILVDLDAHDNSGPYNEAVKEGLEYDARNGDQGWSGLETQTHDENDILALAYTSGTTARPKGVEYTHRGAYLAAMGNVIESGLNSWTPGAQRCHYLWTLPMFHACGWTFPWAVTAVRGTHYTLRKIDYPYIWKLLKEQKISHFNAAPTVNTLLCADSNAAKLPAPVRVTVAASPPSAHLFETMEKLNLQPVHVYGLTETYGPITKGYQLPMWDTLPIKEKYAKMARQGHGFVTSLPARVIKTDMDESGAWSAASILADVIKDGKEIGEIVFVGNICAKGYFKDAAATRKLFDGGVLHSGDLAVWHPDGSIQIMDRAKDIIISGGENIRPWRWNRCWSRTRTFWKQRVWR